MCLAVLDKIRSALSLTTGVAGQLTSDVTFDGQPPPGCGEWFYAVYAGEWRGQSGDADLEEIVGVNVTVTRRSAFAPNDRQGSDVWAKAASGLEVQLRKVILAIHHQYDVMNAANTIITASFTGFVEPLLFINGGKPEPKGLDWFSAEQVEAGKFANAGIAQTLTFGKAKRLQDLVGMG